MTKREIITALITGVLASPNANITEESISGLSSSGLGAFHDLADAIIDGTPGD